MSRPAPPRPPKAPTPGDRGPLGLLALAAVLAAAAAAAFVAPAHAHHGWTAYEEGKQQKIALTVERLAFNNPHGELWSTHEGKPVYVMLSPPGRMVDRGLTADMMPVGTKVVVEVQPSIGTAGEWKALAIEVDGETYSLMR